MIEINPTRLMSNLRELAGFGRFQTGVDRIAFSPEDIAARQWLCSKLAGIGLSADIDEVGNVLGRGQGNGPCVLIGSHTDTVPRGGWLDGALGVIYGLEIAEAAIECRGAAGARIDVISFQDEEGTFLPCLGSKSFCGMLQDCDIDAASSADSRSLREAIRGSGLGERPSLRLEPGRYSAFLETHIEQGPRLETERVPIGVVTGIVGIRRFRLGFTGQADHAGTTPMSMRKDAGAALINLAHSLQTAYREMAGEETVWNFGKATFEPGAANVVPAAADLLVEFRDPGTDVLDRFEKRLHTLACEADRRGGVSVLVERTADIRPKPMDAEIVRRIGEAAERHGVSAKLMPSGAGHDAMIMADHVPSGLMFVPSIGGRSHDISEDTKEADIAFGCQVMATAAELILDSRN